MRKRDYSQLDEMQKEKLLKINSNGMKICALGLLVVILVQWFLNGDFSNIIGELVVYALLAGYVAIAYMFEGLWGERIKPSWKSNLLISLIVSIVIGVLLFIREKTSPEFTIGIPAILLRMAIGLVACFGVLSILLLVYQKRRKTLDDVEE